MTLYEMYFSPTGGTKRVADLIAAVWDCEKRVVDLSARDLDLPTFTAEDICIVAVPSFGGRVPSFLIPRIKGMKGNGARAVMVTAYGNRAFDDTLLELEDTLIDAGFVCACAIAAVTQHSLMPKYGAGRPDAADEAELHDFALQCKAAVSSPALPVAVPGNRPYRLYSGVPMKPKAGRRCNHCGLCAKRCPVQAIPLDNPRLTDDTKCISCMQCVAICPIHTRQLNPLMQAAATLKMRDLCSGRKPNSLFLPSV